MPSLKTLRAELWVQRIRTLVVMAGMGSWMRETQGICTNQLLPIWLISRWMTRESNFCKGNASNSSIRRFSVNAASLNALFFLPQCP